MLPRLPRAVLFPALLAVSLAACAVFKPHFNRPNITVLGIELRKGNLLSQNFAVKLNIDNPNDRALPVQSVRSQISVGGEEIASGLSDRAVLVPANGSVEFDMTVTANLALALLKLADKLHQHADTIDYDLTGEASIDLPFLHNLPFHQTGSLPLNSLR